MIQWFSLRNLRWMAAICGLWLAVPVTTSAFVRMSPPSAEPPNAESPSSESPGSESPGSTAKAPAVAPAGATSAPTGRSPSPPLPSPPGSGPGASDAAQSDSALSATVGTPGDQASPPPREPGFVASGRVAISPPTPEQCRQVADYSTKLAGRAVLIRQGGRVIFERYDRDWSVNRPHPLASGTKSFTGVLAMLAVQDGLLTLEERACDTLTEWRDDPRKSQITVRHLLTLSSGLEPGDRELGGRAGAGGVLGEGAAKRAQRLGLSANGPRPENLNAAALELPSQSDPGTRFAYGPSHFYAFSELLERKLAKAGGADKTTLAYLQNRLLRPLGITPFRIGRDRQGHPNLPGGMVLTAFEWSQFGEFILNRGRIAGTDESGQELLRGDLLQECFQPSRANPRYGLTWWLRGTDPVADGELGNRRRGRLKRAGGAALRDEAEQSPEVWMAAGLGKQRLYVVPGRDLVVVRFAEAAGEGGGFDDGEFLRPLWRTAEQPSESATETR